MIFDDIDPGMILYRSRIVFLFGEIDQAVVAKIVPSLLILDSLSNDPIQLYINSPGGEISSGLAIYDTMQFIKSPVYTICIGRAASMAAWLLAAGENGNRMASENAQIMIHQGRTIMGGTFTDLKINMDEFARTQERMIKILSRHSGNQAQQIADAIQRDRWMTAKEAMEFGIIDRVVASTCST